MVEMVNPMRLNKEALVVQANELLRSKQDELTLLEAKLVRLAVEQVVMEDTDLQTYTCKIGDLADFLGVSKQAIHKEIAKLGDSLMSKIITIADKSKPTERWLKFHWVDTMAYGDGILTIRLSRELKPYLIGLNEHFTEYEYKAIISLPTTNSIRLLELLKSYEHCVTPKSNWFAACDMNIEKLPNEIAFPIEYLKEFFNVSDKYPNNGDFMKRVIVPSVKAINEKNEIHKVSYRTLKSGRAITHILFKLNAWYDKGFIEFVKGE